MLMNTSKLSVRQQGSLLTNVPPFGVLGRGFPAHGNTTRLSTNNIDSSIAGSIDGNCHRAAGL